MDWLTIDDVKQATEGGAWKCVRMSTGEWRFLDCGGYREHRSVVGEGEVPTDAGTFFTFDGVWRMEGRFSSSLNIGCGEDAVEELADMLKPLQRVEKYGMKEDL